MLLYGMHALYKTTTNTLKEASDFTISTLQNNAYYQDFG